MNKRRKLAELQQRRAKLMRQADELIEGLEEEVEEAEQEAQDAQLEALLAEIKALDARIARLEEIIDLEEEGDEGGGEEGDDEGDEPAITDPTLASARGRQKRTRAPAVIVRANTRHMTREQRVEHSKQFREPFLRYIQTGRLDGVPRELRDDPQSIGTDNNSILVPLYLAERIIVALRQKNIMREVGEVRTIPGNTAVPALSGIGQFDFIPERGQYPKVDADIDGPTLYPRKIGGIIKMTDEITLMSGYDVENEVVSNIARFMAPREEYYNLNGTGDTDGVPQGLFVAAPVKITAAADALSYDDIVDLFYSVPEEYRINGTWLMNDLTAAGVRKLKGTDGHPVWQPGLTDQVDRILGRPVRTRPTAPGIEAGKVSVVFGDMSYYKIGDRTEIRILRLNELYAETGEIGFRVDLYTDGKLALSEAVGAIKHGDA